MKYDKIVNDIIIRKYSQLRKEDGCMTLQFIIGQGTADKRTEYIQDIKQIMNEQPDAKFFIIVPEHAKFEGEMKILEDLWKSDEEEDSPFIGSINLQIFSFSRLAWFFLKDKEVFQKKRLSDSGISMLLRKLLLDSKEEFILFRREIEKEGFIQQLTDLFKEFKAGNISVEDLEASISYQSDSPRLLDQQQKIREILSIYKKYCTVVDENYIQYELLLESLANCIYETNAENTYLYIDGYYYFSAQELQIIQAFLHQAAKVSVILDLDKAYVEGPPELTNLFHAAGSTYFQLYQFARSKNIPILHDKKIVSQTDGYQEGIIQLDNYWIQSTSGSKQSPTLQLENKHFEKEIEIWSCDTKQAEIFHIANSINRLIVEKGYRYKDFIILARRVEDYETILKPLFQKANLEVFYDKAEEMRHHPFTDFIDSLFRVRFNYWRYPDIMRLLRTELLIPTVENNEDLSIKQKKELLKEYRDTVDKTENILLAYGYEGNAWFQKNEWSAYRFSEVDEELQSENQPLGMADANKIKVFLQSRLLPFYKKLQAVKTGREAATVIYQFLEKNRIDEQIIFWRDAAIEDNDLEKARQHEQLWKTFILLLDEYVETLGDTPFDARTFHEILMTGFETAAYSIVPPALDEVVFSSIEGARFQPAKVAFIIGATQENLPKAHENRSLLTEEERETLQSTLQAENKYLSLSISESTASEPFIAYQAFLAATKKLYITYPLSVDGSTRIQKISPYIARISKDLNLSIQHKAADITDSSQPEDFIGSKVQNISQLVKLIRNQFTTEDKMPFIWRNILSFLYRDKESVKVMERIFRSLKYKNIPEQLTPEIAEKLYGKNLFLSVSQLESYYLDSYSHFLQYGLRLKERQKYELSPAGAGEFYHEALEHIVRRMAQADQLSVDTVQKIAQEILVHLFGMDKYAILSSSNRMKFIQEQLNETIEHLSTIIYGQRSLTTFQNVKTEAIFGPPGMENELEGMVFPLKNDRKLYLRGKIDRIDKIEKDGKQYLSVLDYKSSQHSFDFIDAYYGLAMQMITYLDIAMLNADRLLASNAEPAGAFYLHVKNPLLKALNKPEEEEFKKQLLSEHKLKGLLIAETELTKIMEPDVELGESALVLPFRYKKSGSFYSNVNDLVTREELDLLIKNNRRRIQEAGNQILSGELKMNPVKDKLYIPSIQGPYRAISQFDSTLAENRYRRLEKLDKSKVLQKLQEEFSEEELEEGSERDGNDSSKNRE